MVGETSDSHTVPGIRLIRMPGSPKWLIVIGVGGSLGTAVRAGLEAAFAPPLGQWPAVTFWINVGGAFLLGGLLEFLAAGGADRGWRRGLRLGVGTGVLGGFTTYSTFSVETAELLRHGYWQVGLGYPLASVVLGVLAALAGFGLARRLHRPRAGGRR